MKGYRTVRRLYHMMIPETIRHQVYKWSPTPVKSAKRRLVASFERDAAHDEIYDDAYYGRFVEPTMQMSAATMAESIATAFEPKRVVDVGCGTGVLMEELRRLNVEVVGFELADAAIARCRQRGLNVQKFDIERDPLPSVRSDLVISTEVAEHLPAGCANRFVELLTCIADTVVLTAATPSVCGTDHVNEQPNEYWIARFASRGYRYDRDLTDRWRSHWSRSGVAGCFWTSVMVYQSEPVSRRPTAV